MDVHSVGFLENWGFGDFQFLNSNPNEQPIETSQLAGRVAHREHDLPRPQPRPASAHRGRGRDCLLEQYRSAKIKKLSPK
jgi:hypothetical protein